MKILVLGLTENHGGVESVVLNYISHFDSEIQTDFLGINHHPFSERKLRESGHKVYVLSCSFFKHPLKTGKTLDAFFRKHAGEYDAIWCNWNDLGETGILKYAKKYGIRIRIVHAHNTKLMMNNHFERMIKGFNMSYNRMRLPHLANEYWACSEEAAKWFFGRKLYSQSRIINNAIDLNRFSPDKDARLSIRKKLNIENKFVIGNVGRLHFQKNQEFAIDVFHAYLKINPDSVLVLIGEGEDENRLKQKVKQLGIEDKVIFTGFQSDINAYLSAFDLFLFPSLFEGLPLAILEAEANGLPVLASREAVVNELLINDNVKLLSLNDSPEQWAEETERLRNTGRRNSESVKTGFSRTGYDLETEAPLLEKYLLEKYETSEG